MELSWLEDFLVLAQSAHFSRAAEARHMTQPAFSRRIRAMEDWLGTPLFHRAHQPVTLTEAGQAFLPAAREILLRLERAREACRELGHSASAALHFTATHSLSFTFFPGWLRALEGAGPFGAIRLTSDSLAACEQIMVQGKAQFLLCHHRPDGSEGLPQEHFQSLQVGSDLLEPLVAPGPDGPRFHLPGSLERPVPWLAYSPESGLGRIIAAASGSPGHLARLEPVFTSHQAAVLKSMALEGRGVAWLPRSLAAAEIAAGTLVRAGGADWDVAVEIRLYRPRTPLGPAAERFWTLAETGAGPS